MKRILMLGGSLAQVHAIKKAKEMGLYVISCDYLPDNPGHKYSDEYHNVSTTDKDAVLELARRLKVDGVVCYASDPAAPTAAYVCERLGLPTSPYESVEILSNKDKFREFLAANGFNCPRSKGYATYEEAAADLGSFRLPVMVKPVDSSGSKGINKLSSPGQLKEFVDDALQYSRSKRFLIEEFIEKKGYQISGDGFSVDGVLKFQSLANEIYGSYRIKDFVPLGECWPFIMGRNVEERVHAELQRLITALGMKSNAYNIEVIVDRNDDIYILELGARNGGSLIPQLIKLATGVDLVEYTIKAALGEDCSDLAMAEPHGFWSNYMIHSTESGRLKEIWMHDDIKKNNFVYLETSFSPGDPVHAFRNSGDALGTMLLRYDSQEEMFDKMNNMHRWVKVIVE